MVLFNYSAKELTAKIVYYGPGLGGKTTCLEYIYKSLPAKVKGKMLSLSTQADRTLFFDFLPMDLGKINNWKVKIQLYTVPGQVFYDATRKIVLKGADGVVFVVDSQNDLKNSNIESWENFKINLRDNNINFKTIPLIIQYNKRDLKDIMSIKELEELINERKVPYFETIATEGKGVVEALKCITKLVLQNLQKQYSKVFMEDKKEEQEVSVSEKESEKDKSAKQVEEPKSLLSNAEEKMYAKPKFYEKEDHDEMKEIDIQSNEEIAELPVADDDLSLDEDQWEKINIAKNNISNNQFSMTETIGSPDISDSENYDNIQEIEEIDELEIIEEIDEVTKEEEEEYSKSKNIKTSPLDETFKTKAKLSDTWKQYKELKKEEIITQKFPGTKIKEIKTSIEIKDDNIIDISSISQIIYPSVPIEMNYDKENNILYVTIKLAFRLK